MSEDVSYKRRRVDLHLNYAFTEYLQPNYGEVKFAVIKTRDKTY